MNNLNITALTVNFKTPELLSDCLTSFRQFYPDIPHIVIDNGGCRESLELLHKLQLNDGKLTIIENPENIGHGLALNQGIENIFTRFVFLLDSDTKVEQGGFLEKMLELFDQDSTLFAAGWLRFVNDSGVAYRNGVEPEGAIRYIHPYACLLHRWRLFWLLHFNDRGAPALNIMRGAMQKDYSVQSFPIEDYVWHKVSGTRGLFDGQIRPATDEEPGEWSRRNI